MYGKMLKLAELGHFWADLGPLQKCFWLLNLNRWTKLNKIINSTSTKNSGHEVKKTTPCNIIKGARNGTNMVQTLLEMAYTYMVAIINMVWK